MRRQMVMRLVMAGVLAVALLAGCATAADYSGYSTEQLRHQLMLERQTVYSNVEKVNRSQYQAVYGNEDSGGPGVTGPGALLHSIAARMHDNRAQAIEMELTKRGEQP